MPIYEFDCPDHGTFEETRSIASRRDPSPCPTCGAASPRIVSLPNVALVSSVNRRATEINERSRHEPRLVTTENKANGGERPRLQASHSSRPWALEHG